MSRDGPAAIPIRALMEGNGGVGRGNVDDVVSGCTNEAGEDGRKVARMASLLAWLPESGPEPPINRPCA